jgi:hypothetical protein
MSIDDGGYTLGSTSEAGLALKVSSVDWNDSWEREVRGGSWITDTRPLLL